MPAETQSLQDKVVVITGASSGIGAATARLLAEQGAKVVLAARREERLTDLVKEIGAERALAVATDVKKPEDCRQLMQRAVDAYGGIDVVMANAGWGMYGGIVDGTDEQLQDMLDTNLAGTVWTVRAGVPWLRERGGGDVVIVSSVAGLRGGADEAVYAATKFGQVGLAGSMDRELREEDIRVTALCPAGVETEFAIGTGRTSGEPKLAAYLRPEDVALQALTVLQQPRRIRTTLWTLWSMAEG